MTRTKRKSDGDIDSEEGNFHVTHACNPSGFRRVYDSLQNHLSADHTLLLERWPFRHFLDLPQIAMSRQFITDMFRRWDSHNCGFVYNDVLFQTTDDDFSLILGLRCRGHCVIERKQKIRSCDISSLVCRRFFPNRGDA
jgi:hypothetical protein